MSEGMANVLYQTTEKNIFICQSFNRLKVWQNKNTFSQDAQKGCPARPQRVKTRRRTLWGMGIGASLRAAGWVGEKSDFFSILLLRKGELGDLSLLDPLLHQCADVEHPFDLLNVIEPGFCAGVRWGEE